MTVTVYQYPNCSTCKKALKWLDAHGVEARTVHLVDETPSVDTLRDLWQRSGEPVRKLFNTSGKVYRSGNYKERLASMTDDEALAELAAQGMLIKRPILDTGDTVLIGFKDTRYADVLG